MERNKKKIKWLLRLVKDNIKIVWIFLSDIFGWRFNPEKILPIIYLHKKDEKEGRIFFLLTEDNEIPKGVIYENSVLTPYEMEITLIRKMELSDKIANKYGVKWTHFVDIGSSLLLLKWAAEISNNDEWIKLYKMRKQILINAYKGGNDIQLHIHSYNIPGSPDFRWEYDYVRNVIYRQKKDKKNRGRTFGGWARQYKEKGNSQEPFTRHGSLECGKKILEEILMPYFPDYKVTCFRAGGWDIGNSEAELKKSFLSLSEAGIMIDSSITKGSISKARWLTDYGMTFEVGAKINKNVYQVILQDREMSNVFELLPTQPIALLGTSSGYITPLDDPGMVENIYNRLLDKNGKIKQGLHFIVEMFHIHNIAGDKTWDDIVEESRDFRKIEDHFRYLIEHCPKIEYLTMTDAARLIVNLKD
jgi:hypothetical protein